MGRAGAMWMVASVTAAPAGETMIGLRSAAVISRVVADELGDAHQRVDDGFDRQPAVLQRRPGAGAGEQRRPR